MATYPPIQVWNNAEPTDRQKAKFGAQELRAIKTYTTAIPSIPLSANATFEQNDTTNSAGSGYDHTSATAHTLTVPSNATVPFRLGSSVNVFNDIGAGVVTIAKESGVTLILAGTGAMTSIAIAATGACMITKRGTNRWFVTGVGLTGTV